MKKLFLIAFCSAMLLACKKEEGVGGDASISGLVWAKAVNSTGTVIQGEYPAEDTYVYIVYGDNVGYDKRIKTDYNGYFKFSYLYPGDYTLYAYSYNPDPTVLDMQSPVIRKVKIQGRKESVEVGKIEILVNP